LPTCSFVASGFWGFDVPQQHLACELQDTFYLSDPGRGITTSGFPESRVHEHGGYGSVGYCAPWSNAESHKPLRTHTTVSSAHMLASWYRSEAPNVAGATDPPHPRHSSIYLVPVSERGQTPARIILSSPHTSKSNLRRRSSIWTISTRSPRNVLSSSSSSAECHRLPRHSRTRFCWPLRSSLRTTVTPPQRSGEPLMTRVRDNYGPSAICSTSPIRPRPYLRTCRIPRKEWRLAGAGAGAKHRAALSRYRRGVWP